MARSSQSTLGEREGAYAAPRRAGRDASNATLGQGREAVCLRWTAWQIDAGRPVRRAQPALRQALHDGPPTDQSVRRVLTGSRPRRRRARAPPQSRRVLCRRGTRADRRDRNCPQADGVERPVGLVLPLRVQLRLPRVLYPGADRGGSGLLQLRLRGSRAGGSLRRQRVHQGRRRPKLSLLFGLRTGGRNIPPPPPISPPPPRE